MTSGAKSQGRFGKQDFVYVPEKDVYRCPAGEQLTYRFMAEEHGKTIRRYWTTGCAALLLLQILLLDPHEAALGGRAAGICLFHPAAATRAA
jgi:hypothetical protein